MRVDDPCWIDFADKVPQQYSNNGKKAWFSWVTIGYRSGAAGDSRKGVRITEIVQLETQNWGAGLRVGLYIALAGFSARYVADIATLNGRDCITGRQQ
jgi:hypothetical protein